ncbi:flavin reductase [Candidatus Bathyarchaeota archaeon]|nr:flavin reductase [Candidatus Bathyarchaeota archaeon]
MKKIPSNQTPKIHTQNHKNTNALKTEINLTSSYRLLHPMHTVLVSCVGKAGKPNIITLAWAMPTSITPPLVALSIAPKRHSHTHPRNRRVRNQHPNNRHTKRNTTLWQN